MATDGTTITNFLKPYNLFNSKSFQFSFQFVSNFIKIKTWILLLELVSCIVAERQTICTGFWQ